MPDAATHGRRRGDARPGIRRPRRPEARADPGASPYGRCTATATATATSTSTKADGLRLGDGHHRDQRDGGDRVGRHARDRGKAQSALQRRCARHRHAAADDGGHDERYRAEPTAGSPCDAECQPPERRGQRRGQHPARPPARPPASQADVIAVHATRSARWCRPMPPAGAPRVSRRPNRAHATVAPSGARRSQRRPAIDVARSGTRSGRLAARRPPDRWARGLPRRPGRVATRR